ncbi:unnamed protein product [Caenorhabditis auriculariae]|uniref:Uncharacterized protein n=1 Tax=Caenorhabditis auriculariae TaxID=2777116 RepID=A0A8S1HYT7_9PELO|nr:unnamed protein product [Caenorhabditis auriculariae]
MGNLLSCIFRQFRIAFNSILLLILRLKDWCCPSDNSNRNDEENEAERIIRRHQRDQQRLQEEHEERLRALERAGYDEMERRREIERQERENDENLRQQARTQRIREEKEQEAARKARMEAQNEEHRRKMRKLQEDSDKKIAELKWNSEQKSARDLQEYQENCRRTQELERKRQEEFERDRDSWQAAEQAKEARHQADMRSRDERMAQEQLEHEKRMRKIKEDAEEVQREQYRRWEERQKLANAQLRELFEMVLQRRWNQMIENRWANQLCFLRGANRPVAREFRDLHQQFNATVLQQNKEKNLQYIAMSVNVRGERLEDYYRQTGAEFLREIQRSTDDVAEKCQALKTALISFRGECERGTASSLATAKSLADDLERNVAKIPTIHQLKEKFEGSWNNPAREDDYQGSNVFITEVID